MIELKKSNINPSARVALSIHCAAMMCNTDFDPKETIKLSALKEKEYARQKELFEKLLDIDKKWTLNKMCAQFEMNDALKNDANRLLNEYVKKNPLLNETNNTSFLAMAIYQSFRIRKMKCNTVKPKLIQLSKMSGKMWKALEEQWTNWIDTNTPLANIEKRNDDVENPIDTREYETNETGVKESNKKILSFFSVFQMIWIHQIKMALIATHLKSMKRFRTRNGIKK